MERHPIKLSIIIVNYHSERFLEACLLSLREKVLNRVSGQIIIVNNDQSESLEKIKASFPEIIILNNKNRGFGEACNVGAKEARGEYLLFINPDTEILTLNVEEVLAVVEKKSDAAVVGSCLMTEKGEIQKWSAGKEISFGDLLKNNLGLSSGQRIWKSEKPMSVAWVAGTALFVRKNIFDKLQGFDEKFFMYFEDVDFCKRARNIGQRVVYFPQFKVIHKSGESYINKSEQKKNYYDSQEYYFKKHHGPRQAFLVKWLRKIFS